jgi:3'-phosphoadenosine 5'-phosphosulfate sulfotransferase
MSWDVEGLGSERWIAVVVDALRWRVETANLNH